MQKHLHRTRMMSVHKLHFQKGIFFAQYAGPVSQQDAERWLIKLHGCAVQQPLPLVALLDLRETTHLAVAAQRMMIDASYNPEVAALVIAARSRVMLQTAACIQRMSAAQRIHVFPSFVRAFDFSRGLVDNFAVVCT